MMINGGSYALYLSLLSYLASIEFHKAAFIYSSVVLCVGLTFRQGLEGMLNRLTQHVCVRSL